MRETIPLSQRRFDWLIIAFFILNLGFITYIVDLEQLVIANPYHFTYPIWPPTFFVNMVHALWSSLRSVADGASRVVESHDLV